MVAVLVEAISGAGAISGVADTSVEPISLAVTMGAITVGTAATTDTITRAVDIGTADAGTEEVGTRTVSGVIPTTMTTIMMVMVDVAEDAVHNINTHLSQFIHSSQSTHHTHPIIAIHTTTVLMAINI